MDNELHDGFRKRKSQIKKIKTYPDSRRINFTMEANQYETIYSILIYCLS